MMTGEEVDKVIMKMAKIVDKNTKTDADRVMIANLFRYVTELAVARHSLKELDKKEAVK